mgnify:CR=1 FL=1
MREIELSRGLVSIVDDADYDWVAQWKWTACVGSSGLVYAVRRAKATESAGRPQIAMHRAILNAPLHLLVDHINHDTLDNRRENLRLCSASQNNMNKRLNRRSTSGHKGVSWDASEGQWAVKIKVNRREIWLGRYDNIDDAVAAYRNGSLQYHGDFGLSE